MYLEGKGRVLAIDLDPFDHNQSHSVSSLEFTYIPGIEKIYKTYRKSNLGRFQGSSSAGEIQQYLQAQIYLSSRSTKTTTWAPTCAKYPPIPDIWDIPTPQLMKTKEVNPRALYALDRELRGSTGVQPNALPIPPGRKRATIRQHPCDSSPTTSHHRATTLTMGKGPLEKSFQFEKKNQDLVKLPQYAKVEKRPIPHAPVASPYAGPSVPKIVYVSSKTPFMSAVKRVQKLLRQAEKRATAGISLEDTQKTEKQKFAELAKAADTREEIFVKATGKAIEKALNVGKWFEEKEAEYTARVTTGSVLVVDDVVEDEDKKEREMRKQQRQERAQDTAGQKDSVKSEESASKDLAKKRKREVPKGSEDDELPETRTRWIKMVEVAISLK
ncbi:hypothetical protein PENDEC_c002G02821 [Penicillium decumbens]|uniref:Uncharacterized protein n=1 Tax=Penicillium decumbens TaxID=69771 RepID=A0A1V6PM70_PENDC|nr:hypothetical protein PENDEC_c002G02821 [Penicillium decumbens]